MVKIIEIIGDLFSAPNTFSIAHCVSADMKLAKGIAIKFKEKFGRIRELQAQNVTTGGVAFIKKEERFIYYLVTKEFCYHKPTYQSLFDSLYAMRNHMVKYGVTHLAIPKIGCGLDGLVWHKVKDQIEEVFKNDAMEISVYVQAPKEN